MVPTRCDALAQGGQASQKCIDGMLLHLSDTCLTGRVGVSAATVPNLHQLGIIQKLLHACSFTVV